MLSLPVCVQLVEMSGAIQIRGLWRPSLWVAPAFFFLHEGLSVAPQIRRALWNDAQCDRWGDVVADGAGRALWVLLINVRI